MVRAAVFFPLTLLKGRLWCGGVVVTGVGGRRSFATTSRPAPPTDTAQYCLDLLRRCEYENFLAVLLVPGQSRAAAVAVRAFNIEVSQGVDVVSEPLMARMRLQFWRETLERLYHDDVPRQPVAVQLHQAIRRHELSKRWLLRLVEGREALLERPQFRTCQELEAHCDQSNVPLYYLTLQALGIQSVEADHAASHVGKAEGIMRVVRSVPHFGTQRKVFLPWDTLMKHSVSQEEVIRGSREQKMKDVIYETSSLAHQHLQQARQLMGGVSVEGRAALLPAVGVGSYLRALQQADFDVFHSSLQHRNTWLPLSLLWARLTRSY